MLSSIPANGQKDLQELENHLLGGVRTIEPRATRFLEGTRTRFLANINTKIDNNNWPNVIRIRAPSSAKSSLSLTAKSLLQRQGQLVTYVGFDRHKAAATTSTALRHVPYGLAGRLLSHTNTLLEQLQEQEVDLDSTMDVFTFLLKDPLSNLASAVDHPLVVIFALR